MWSRSTTASLTRSAPFAGQVVGFVLTGEGLPTVYVSGDNASLDAVREIAERFAPIDTALLFAGAPRFPMVFDGNLIVLAVRRRPRPPGFSTPAVSSRSTTTAGPSSPRTATSHFRWPRLSVFPALHGRWSAFDAAADGEDGQA